MRTPVFITLGAVILVQSPNVLATSCVPPKNPTTASVSQRQFQSTETILLAQIDHIERLSPASSALTVTVKETLKGIPPSTSVLILRDIPPYMPYRLGDTHLFVAADNRILACANKLWGVPEEAVVAAIRRIAKKP